MGFIFKHFLWNDQYQVSRILSLHNISMNILYFIRHGETIRNYDKHQILSNKQITEEQLNLQLTKYNKGKLNSIYLDCGLTQKGYQQCKQARQKMQDKQIKLVIVSPLRRALISCDQIFRNHKNKPKIIVEPLLTEILHSATNIGSKLLESIVEFDYFDFSKFKNKQPFWYIEILPNFIKEELMNTINQRNIITPEEIAEVVLEYLQKNKRLETIDDLIVRSKILKQKIKEYSEMYRGHIVIVGHSKIGKSITNQKQHNKQYFHSEKFKNGRIYEIDIDTFDRIQN